MHGIVSQRLAELRYKATGNGNGKSEQKENWSYIEREIEGKSSQQNVNWPHNPKQTREGFCQLYVTKVFQIPFSVFQKLKCKWPWTSEITMICTCFSFSVPVTLCDGVKEDTVPKPESEDTYLSHCRLRKGIFWALGQWMKMGETYACPSKCSYHPVFAMQWARQQTSRTEHLTSETKQKPLCLLTILRFYSSSIIASFHTAKQRPFLRDRRVEEGYQKLFIALSWSITLEGAKKNFHVSTRSFHCSRKCLN